MALDYIYKLHIRASSYTFKTKKYVYFIVSLMKYLNTLLNTVTPYTQNEAWVMVDDVKMVLLRYNSVMGKNYPFKSGYNIFSWKHLVDKL